MRFVLSAVFVAVVFLAGLGVARAAPLEAYGKLPTLEDIQISPDGTMLAYATTDGEMRRVIIQRLADRSIVTGLNFGAEKLRDLQWAGSGHLLITVSTTASVAGLEGGRREWQMVFDFDIATRKQRGLLEKSEDAMNVVRGAPEVRIVNGEAVVFLRGIHFGDYKGRLALFQSNLATGKLKMIEAPTERVEDWVIDAAGVPVAQAAYDQKGQTWTLRVRDGDRWVVRETGASPTGAPALGGLGRDGRSFLLRTNAEGEDRELLEYSRSPADKTVTAVPDGLRRLIHDPRTQALIGGSALVGDTLRYTFFDPKDQTAWVGLVKPFKTDQVSLVSWSDDRRKVVVRVEGYLNGAAFALVDLDTKKAEFLGDIYVAVPPADVAEMRPVSYKAADGTPIRGYLTLPRGREAKALPLVVLPHGGPAVRDTPGFDWWAQALASRGYAVLQPNFRGSAGYGREHLEAGYGQWGRKMQTDLSDGVRDLAARGLIDPKRVCIVGASYGGYAALAGAAIDTGVYRCAASIAGPSDLRAMLRSEADDAGRNSATLRYWTRFMGVDGVRDPDLAGISPASQAARVAIPVLLVHGKDDTVVPYEQSQIMAAALKKAGKPVTFVTLDGEDHWLSRGATRAQMLQATVSFLEANNPPN